MKRRYPADSKNYLIQGPGLHYFILTEYEEESAENRLIHKGGELFPKRLRGTKER